MARPKKQVAEVVQSGEHLDPLTHKTSNYDMVRLEDGTYEYRYDDGRIVPAGFTLPAYPQK